jgi:acetyl-CoA carboxylase biotin carboxyl carrier protein
MDPHLTNEDVADILALLDSLPYDELDLETPRFRLTLRRTPAGWTQSTQVRAAPEPLAAPQAAAPGGAAPGGAAVGVKGTPPPSIGGKGPFTPLEGDGNGGTGPFTPVDGEAGGAGVLAEGDWGGGGEDDAGLVAVRAPLPGTFYRAPRPGAPPFVEVGSQVGADTVIGIVETMKLMNSVPAGVAGVVAEFCVANAEFAAQGAALLRIRADR